MAYERPGVLIKKDVPGSKVPLPERPLIPGTTYVDTWWNRMLHLWEISHDPLTNIAPNLLVIDEGSYQVFLEECRDRHSCFFSGMVAITPRKGKSEVYFFHKSSQVTIPEGGFNDF